MSEATTTPRTTTPGPIKDDAIPASSPASRPVTGAEPPKANPGQQQWVPPAAAPTKNRELTDVEKQVIKDEKTKKDLLKNLSRPRRKGSKPTRSDLMAAAAKAGDIEGVLEHWLQCEGDRDLIYVMQYVREAMTNLAERDPKHLVQYAFNRMLVQQVAMMMRVERRISTEIASHDKHNPDSSLPSEVMNEWLPRLERIQQTIQSTSKNMASTLHAFSLAQEGTKLERLKGGRVVPMHPEGDVGNSKEAAV